MAAFSSLVVSCRLLALVRATWSLIVFHVCASAAAALGSRGTESDRTGATRPTKLTKAGEAGLEDEPFATAAEDDEGVEAAAEGTDEVRGRGCGLALPELLWLELLGLLGRCLRASTVRLAEEDRSGPLEEAALEGEEDQGEEGGGDAWGARGGAKLCHWGAVRGGAPLDEVGGGGGGGEEVEVACALGLAGGGFSLLWPWEAEALGGGLAPGAVRTGRPRSGGSRTRMRPRGGASTAAATAAAAAATADGAAAAAAVASTAAAAAAATAAAEGAPEKLEPRAPPSGCSPPVQTPGS